MKTDPVAALEAREAEIEQALSALEAERARIRKAKKILLSTGSATEEETQSVAEPSPSPKSLPAVRPAGIPSNPDMIFEALSFASAQGVIGFEPAEITI